MLVRGILIADLWGRSKSYLIAARHPTILGFFVCFFVATLAFLCFIIHLDAPKLSDWHFFWGEQIFFFLLQTLESEDLVGGPAVFSQHCSEILPLGCHFLPQKPDFAGGCLLVFSLFACFFAGRCLQPRELGGAGGGGKVEAYNLSILQLDVC